jgi:hypothetical protein
MVLLPLLLLDAPYQRAGRLQNRHKTQTIVQVAFTLAKLFSLPGDQERAASRTLARELNNPAERVGLARTR